jgi:CBS domain-containing protein
MPCAADILQMKGSDIHAIAPGATVLEAIHKMNQHKLGALLVTQDGSEHGRVVGMFTERDVLCRVVGELRNPAETKVAEVMTSEVICCPPSTDMDEVSTIMQQRRIRHIPVCDDQGKVYGMISIGDVNAYHVMHQEEQITFLNGYIYGRA